jgi:tetratricopeptide (TPR) repeat protein
MASTAPRDRGRLAAFHKLIRDARSPGRVVKNPLAAGVCSADPRHLAAPFQRALQASLYRLSPRHRAIITRYDLDGKGVDELCKAMGLSRRQFFRDHRAALEQLASVMLPADGGAPASRLPENAALQVSPMPVATLATSLASGLQNAGAYGEAMAVLSRTCDGRESTIVRLEATLDIANLQVESGDVAGACAALEQARKLADPAILAARPRLAARLDLIEGHLVSSHVVRQQRYESACRVLQSSQETATDAAANGALLVETLYALSLSHDHRGKWPAARRAAQEALALTEHFALEETPLGLLVLANYAMRDARQFGNVDSALATLRSCLGRALRNGWVRVTGDVAVHFINLNLMRSHYVQALRWRRWISDVDETRLTVRTRNFLAVDTAHALTMLGRPDRAQGVLQSGDDEGLAFHGAREYWRAEALQAGGNMSRALKLAGRALDGASDADSEKGRARSKRVLAKCQYALGHTRSARKSMEECLELSEQFASPYDLLLSISAARRIELNVENDEGELAQLLRGSAADAEFAPPNNDVALTGG